MATKVLRGAALDTLTRVDEDNLPVQALYPVGTDTPTAAGAIVVPGADWNARLAYGWDVVQPVLVGSGPDALRHANKQILDALMAGATGVMLWLDRAAADHFAVLFDNVTLSAISIQLFAGEDGADSAAVYEHLLAYAEACGVAATDLNVSLGTNVITPNCATADWLMDQLADGSSGPRHAYDVNGLEWHNRGTTAAGEIGLCLSAAAALLRASSDPSPCARQMTITLGLTADVLAGLSKIRAMRVAWAGLMDAFGLDPADHPAFITVMPGVRMFTLLDQDTNMLRITTALLAGALGGANRMGSWGHTVLGGETDAARRFTRMTQLLLLEESGMGRALDAAAGAPALEARTDAMAQAGWAVMQALEAAGGLTNAACWDDIHQMVTTDARDRAARLAAGNVAGNTAGNTAGNAAADGRMVGVTWHPSASPPAALDPIMNAHFASVERPAARVEALRRAAMNAAPRIVILRPADMDAATAAQERMVTSWLAIGGMTAMGLPADAVADVTTARPDLVIALDGVTVPDGIAGPDGGASPVMLAAEIAAASDQLIGLEQILANVRSQETSHA